MTMGNIILCEEVLCQIVEIITFYNLILETASISLKNVQNRTSLGSLKDEKKLLPFLHERLFKFKDSSHAVLEVSLWLITFQILNKLEALCSTFLLMF